MIILPIFSDLNGNAYGWSPMWQIDWNRDVLVRDALHGDTLQDNYDAGSNLLFCISFDSLFNVLVRRKKIG